MRDKTVFDVHAIDVDALARSYGLAVTPRVRFLRKQDRQKTASAETEVKEEKMETTVDDDEKPSSATMALDGDADEDDDLLTLKMTHVPRRERKTKEENDM